MKLDTLIHPSENEASSSDEKVSRKIWKTRNLLQNCLDRFTREAVKGGDSRSWFDNE